VPDKTPFRIEDHSKTGRRRRVARSPHKRLGLMATAFTMEQSFYTDRLVAAALNRAFVENN